MRRIATMAMTTAALLAAPAAASAAETVFVQMTVMTYWSATGQVDTVTVADGTGVHAGNHVISETTSPSGGTGPGCDVIAADSAVCKLAGSLWVDTLDQDDTIAVTAGLPAYLDGGTGHDRIDAGPRTDVVRGNDGNDTLDGRGGGDVVYGGAGDDRIEARDGVADTIDCGDGDDRAAIDAIDTAANCEVDPPVEPAPAEGPALDTVDTVDTVDAVAPPPSAAPGATPLVPLPLALAKPVGVASPVAKVAPDGSAALQMTCAATELAGCTGVVYLDPAPRGSAKGKANGKARAKSKAKPKARPRALLARRGRYGRSPFVIGAGKQARLKVKLTPIARRALRLPSARRARHARRGRRVRARLTVVQRGRAPIRSVVELRG